MGAMRRKREQIVSCLSDARMGQKVDRKRVRLWKGFGMKGLERMDFESGKANKKRRRELGLSHLPEEGRGGGSPVEDGSRLRYERRRGELSPADAYTRRPGASRRAAASLSTVSAKSIELIC